MYDEYKLTRSKKKNIEVFLLLKHIKYFYDYYHYKIFTKIISIKTQVLIS